MHSDAASQIASATSRTIVSVHGSAPNALQSDCVPARSPVHQLFQPMGGVRPRPLS